MTFNLTAPALFTDEELAVLAFYAGESICHPDPNYRLAFDELAYPGAVLSLVEELQQRRTADKNCFMFGIATPEGNAYFEDFCVSSDRGLMEDEAEVLNDTFETDGYRVVALHTALPLTDSERAELQQYSELYHTQEKRLFKLAQRIKGAAFDKYSHSPSQAIDALEVAVFGEGDACSAAITADAPQLTPEGWKLVPIEPTEDMIIAGFESEPNKVFSEEKDWQAYESMSGCQQAAHRAELCYAAMLAAAPQEVKCE